MTEPTTFCQCRAHDAADPCPNEAASGERCPPCEAKCPDEAP